MSGANTDGGMPARRAVTRWAWRLCRRDWRQHLLIVCLLTAAVAAAIGFSCAAYNIAPSSGRAEFGDANYFLRFNDPDPATLPTKLDAATAWFGAIDPIGHRPVPVPGTVKHIDYRSQQTDGPFSKPLLDLRSGRYPTADDEAAVTDWVAESLGARIGSTIDLDGVGRTVVGVVENPSNLDDEFVLLPASALATSDFVTMLVKASAERVDSFRPPGDTGRIVSSRGDVPEDVIAAVITLVVSTLVLFLVALIAAASFTVIAQRRLPQLGMMSAVGATEKHLRLTMLATGAVTGVVASVLGAVIGLGGWILVASNMEGAVGFRIDPFNVPWWLVVVGMLLAIITATGAAWWPGRTMSRIPAVLALSGRPPRPAALHRSALLAAALLIGGVVCLAIGGNATNGVSTIDLFLIAVGTLAILAGVLLIGPLAIRVLGSCASRVPVAARLALRDLSRYQARSGAALAAIALALGIPVAVVAATAAAENNLGPGNLSSSQLLVHPAELDGPFISDPSGIDNLQAGVDALAAALHDPTVIRLDAATSPNAKPAPGMNGTLAISIARHLVNGWEDLGLIFVASPELLAEYGLTADDLAPDADILTNQGGNVDIVDTSILNAGARPEFEHLESTHTLPTTYTSLPRGIVIASQLSGRGWEATPSGQWLIQTTKPISSSELSAARIIATQYGFEIESRDSQQSLANLRLGAVAVGMLLALGILAMTVGLIRSESAGELRTLTATGAASSTRRNITATTAGGLAGLGAILGIAGAYIALAAGRMNDLTPLPVLDLLTIVVGTPLAAAAVGWVFAGREPAVIARRPID